MWHYNVFYTITEEQESLFLFWSETELIDWLILEVHFETALIV